MIRRTLPLVLAAALLAPRTARALVSIEAFYGVAHPPSADFSSAVNDPNLFKSALQIAGGDVILHLGLLEVGGIVDATFGSDTASQTAIGGLVGVGIDLGSLRLEGLGELGGHKYGNFLNNPNVITASSTDQWLMYVGLRPGVAYRFGLGPVGLLVGLWAYVRWDLSTTDVPVTVASAGTQTAGSLKLGGTSIGAALRVGIDL